jgi:hypothetical protein
MERDSDAAKSIGHHSTHFDVSPRRYRVSSWIIVDQDDCRGPVKQRHKDDFSWIKLHVCHRVAPDGMLADQAALAIEQQGEHLLDLTATKTVERKPAKTIEGCDSRTSIALFPERRMMQTSEGRNEASDFGRGSGMSADLIGGCLKQRCDRADKGRACRGGLQRMPHTTVFHEFGERDDRGHRCWALQRIRHGLELDPARAMLEVGG